MKSYNHASYDYVHITEILFDEISKIDLVMLGEPTQSPVTWYNKLEKKPAVVTNGGFFNMSTGKTVMSLVDEKITVSASEIPSGMAIIDDKLLQITSKTDAGRDYISAYPVLIENGKVANTEYAKEIDYAARRTVYAWNDSTLYVITVEKPGLAFAKLQELLLGMNVHSAVNLDGGGSTIKLLEGKKVTTQVYVRPVDNAIAIYLEDKQKETESTMCKKPDSQTPPTEMQLACDWAVEKGIFIGDGKGNYNWQSPITREQFATILYRIFNMEHMK